MLNKKGVSWGRCNEKHYNYSVNQSQAKVISSLPPTELTGQRQTFSDVSVTILGGNKIIAQIWAQTSISKKNCLTFRVLLPKNPGTEEPGREQRWEKGSDYLDWFYSSMPVYLPEMDFWISKAVRSQGPIVWRERQSCHLRGVGR